MLGSVPNGLPQIALHQVAGAERVEFRTDDTLTLTRGGPAEATGFFELSEKPRLDLHLVASPHRISEERIHTLDQLRANGSISQSEYESRRKAILDSI